MSIGSPELLIMIVVGSLYFIYTKAIKVNRDRSGTAIKTTKSKKKNPLLTNIAIITVVILLLITSSGCSTKEPTTVINNNVKQEQDASETQPLGDSLSSEGTQPSEDSLSSDGVQPSEDSLSSEEAQSSEETSLSEKTQSSEDTPKPDIEIIHPVEEINWQTNMGGIAKNIPDGYELWIVVYSHKKEQYYPYTEVVPQYDEWVIPITIGYMDNTYEKFDIIALLADKEAQERFNSYLTAKEENDEFLYLQGIYHIPDGAKEYSRVTLTRRPDYEDDTIDL